MLACICVRVCRFRADGVLVLEGLRQLEGIYHICRLHNHIGDGLREEDARRTFALTSCSNGSISELFSTNSHVDLFGRLSDRRWLPISVSSTFSLGRAPPASSSATVWPRLRMRRAPSSTADPAVVWLFSVHRESKYSNRFIVLEISRKAGGFCSASWPLAGYTQAMPCLEQLVQGTARSQRTFRRRHASQDRVPSL